MRIATGLAATAAVLILSSQTARAQRGPAAVSVAEIIQKEVASGQTFVGTVHPIKRSVIGSAVGGRVAEFPVNEGDYVKQDQPLAQLLTNTINLELTAEEAELDLRRYELNELKNGSRPDEIKRAKALMLAAKAESEYQTKRRKRLESLYARKAVNDDDIQQVVSESIRADEMYQEALAAYNLTVEGPRQEKIDQATARKDMQKALVDTLASKVVKHTIKSPFNGYVVAEHTEVGQWVNSGELVAEVIALDQVDVTVQVLENHIPHVRLDMEVRVEVPAIPDQVFTGKVALIVPQADVRARTFPVKVRIKNTITDDGPLLKSGMLARAVLPTGAKQSALLVSKDALVLGGPSPMIYVVDHGEGDQKQGKARAVPVRVGVSEGRLIQVMGDLEPGQQVVIRGNERLLPGQDVVVKEILPPDAEPQAKAINTNG
ncbi:efflux RND transporter periplasmic adaptor subunit [Gimesia panareensis]|uniref:efflux RND transporter periplasmic adaptor subunit n=1 Tax=Gimesia panareensis TaxID=2527978 RepID=UPI00118CE159|nr:efflux RND transporter periplasmic adaptor subunit [Gimesia panareensis]QDU51156.1 Cation efflux system protein CusB precursor [Gimesia panareensis]